MQQNMNKIKQLTKTCMIQRNKIKRLNEKVRKRNKKIAVLNDIIEHLKETNKINAEESLLLKECAGPEDFLKRQIAKSKGLPLTRKYSEEIRKFALTLHFLSPKAYNFVRNTYNTYLPHTRTLCKWYEHIDCETGFTKEAFDLLKQKVADSPHPVVCSLIFDEMAIRKSLTWDPKAQKCYGRVDYGHNLDSDSVDEANQSLVILLNCINGTWKLPIGYFFITTLTGEQKSILIKAAIQLCENVGVKVVSITCDGPAPNFSMFESLGKNIMINPNSTSFQCSNSQIQAFIDPCHAIKLVRNAFGELKVFVDHMGRRIDFKHLELLLELQEKKGLHLANKISKAHIIFDKQKMKVKLATQLFCSSVADAYRDGLVYASYGVQDIVKKVEKLIKPILNDKTIPENYYLYVFKFLTEFYNTENLFCLRSDPEHNSNHRLLLIKSVIKTYLDLRFRYHGTKINDAVSHRSFLTKLILFRNE